MWELDTEYISKFDLLHIGALLDVLPNGDEALDHLLSLSANRVLIGRMKTTTENSYYNEYVAYDEISTCEYYHNIANFQNLCNKYNYYMENMRNSFYLIKQ